MKFERIAVIVTIYIALLTSLSTGIFAQSAQSVKKINIAVLNLKSSSGVTADEAEIISDRLRSELFNTGMVNIMERDQMAELLKEEKFQNSGMTDSIIVEMGKKLGVQQIVAGSIGKVGTIYLVNLRVIDVKTAQIIRVVSRDLNGLEIVVTNLRSISTDLFSSTPPSDQVGTVKEAPQVSAPAPAAGSYQPGPTVSPTPEYQTSNSGTLAEQGAPLTKPTEKPSAVHFGMRLGSSILFGKPDIIGDTSWKAICTSYTSSTEFDPDVSLKVVFGGNNGPFLALSGGFGVGVWTENYSFTNNYISDSSFTGYVNESLKMAFVSVSFHAGADVGIALGPVRPTIGIQLGIQGLSISNNSSITSVATGKTFDTVTTLSGSGTSINLKAGIEYQLSKNISLEFNLLYQALEFKATDKTGDYNTANYHYTVQTPHEGIDLAFDFYF